MIQLQAVFLLLLLLTAATGTLALEAQQPPADEGRFLGCRIDSADQLLPLASFSALADDSSCCSCLCRQQPTLLAASSQRWCFCLNQLAAVANLSRDCQQLPSANQELLRFYWLSDQPPANASQTALVAPPLHRSDADYIHLTPLRCAKAGQTTGTLYFLDDCVHLCMEQQQDYIALGSPFSPDKVTPYVACSCSDEDSFGTTLPSNRCDHACWRSGDTLNMSCGGSNALSVYRIEESGHGSTLSSEGTTFISTRASPCVSSPECPDAGTRVGDSCYFTYALRDEPGPTTYAMAVDLCSSSFLKSSDWRVWAVETEQEFSNVYNNFIYQRCISDGYDVVTSATWRTGGTVQWQGWPSSSPAQPWFTSQVSLQPQDGYVVVLSETDHSFGQHQLRYMDPQALPSLAYAICELPLTEPTTTAEPTSSTTMAPTTTTPVITSTTTMPSSSTSSTPVPDPKTPDDNINDIIKSLNTSTDISPDTVKKAVSELLKNIKKQSDQERDLTSDKQFTFDAVRLVDTLLAPIAPWQSMEQDELQTTSQQLLTGTEQAGFLLAQSIEVADSDDVLQKVTGHVTLSAASVRRSVTNHTFRFPNDDDAASWIDLPPGYHLAAPDHSERVRQVGVLYNAPSLNILLSPGTNSHRYTEKQLNSPVLGFTLGSAGSTVKFSGQGATLRLRFSRLSKQPVERNVWRHLYPGEEPASVPDTAICAYIHTNRMNWRPDGCHLKVEGRDHASCECTHLTSFAILMDYHDYVGTPMALSILTLVLGSTSVLCLVITWVVFTFNRSLRCSRTTITRNLCATYAVGLTLLLTIVDRKLVLLSDDACMAVGVVVHYCFLCVFSWSLVEGVHLYKVLRHVFEPKSNSMIRYYLYAYLTPAVVVIATNVTAIVTGENAYVRDEFCWLTSPYFIWFFNGPVAIVLAVNLFVITLAYRSASMLKVNQLRAKKEKLKRWLKGWFSLSCLLGVQWVIGYVYVDGSNVFDYIFTAFNCSQGILIFVFHCVLRTRTRQILLGRSTQSKSSMMMNSVYGQITLAQRKDRQSRQSRISRDTSITTLSSRSRPTTASSDTPDSSPASERSQSSCSSSGSLKGRLLRRSTARHARSSVTSQLSVRGGPAPDQLQPTSSLRGRVNLAFQLEEPLPDITEEAEQSSPPILLPPDDSLTCHLPAPRRTNRADVHRSHSTATCRRGHLY